MDTPVTAKAAILAALSRGPAFGLEIIERVSKLTNGVLVLNQGSVYPALHDLERSGFIEAPEKPVPSQRWGRPRRTYVLTEKGRGLALAHHLAMRRLFD